MKIKISITIFLLNTFICLSQISLVDTSLVALFDSTNKFYLLRENTQVSKSDIINIGNSNSLRINNSNSFSLQKSDTDEVGYIHYDYHQFFNGIQIIGASLKIHCNTNNIVKSINGDIADLITLNTNPSFNTTSAIDYAKAIFPTSTFAWEDEASEQTIKLEEEDSTASNVPLPTLVIYNTGSEYKLAYKMNIALASPAGSWEVYINAQTGVLLKKLDNIKSCFKTKNNVTPNNGHTYSTSKVPSDVLSCDGYHTGTGSTLYYGSQYIITEKFKPNIFDCKYKLKDDYTGTSLYTRDYNGGNIQDITDQTNNWTYLVTQPGVTAHWCLEMTHDFYRFTYNRNSVDNGYKQIKSYINKPTYLGSQNNASWDVSNSSINIGNGQGNNSIAYNDWTTLDIIGHEFTHGVNDYEANLTYEAESGALDESFADIFGTMVEFYTKANHSANGSGNYLCGEDMIIAGALRNLSNPNQFNQPDTYGGTFWANTNYISNDYGGVHTNSGIQNFWFYLLSEGGSGTNDNGNQYCVSGIGKDKAAQIAYRNLTTYLSANSNYSNARFYSIQSAIDLYGNGSNEVAQVASAWYAVGVGSQFNGQINIQNITVNSPGIIDKHQNAKINISNVVVNPASGTTTTFYVSSNTEIELLPSVDFNQGTWVELYIAPACNGGARMANPNNDNSTSTNDGKSEVLRKNNSEIQVYDLNIFPNPNSGEFNILLDNQIELPKSIVIRDVMGKEIKTIINPTLYEQTFDMKYLNDGLYIINVFYSDKTISKRIVKN